MVMEWVCEVGVGFGIVVDVIILYQLVCLVCYVEICGVKFCLQCGYYFVMVVLCGGCYVELLVGSCFCLECGKFIGVMDLFGMLLLLC